MKTAYFDCFSGISGDMVLGALLDLGLPEAALLDEFAKLRVEGFSFRVAREKRGAIAGSRALIEIGHQPPRNYEEIRHLIGDSRLDEPVKRNSLAVFERLARAEALVHQVSVARVHFHEVGALDSILDIVGAAAGLHLLGIHRVVASPVPLGRGFVQTHHGLLPIPAPATVLLLSGIPVRSSGVERELVTPTGAAILATLAESFGSIPDMEIADTGYGVGANLASDPPNLLRIITGSSRPPLLRRDLLLIETNIDDMNPEFYNYVQEELFGMGVLDVGIIPFQMKKDRPGSLLRVLAEPSLEGAVLEVLFRETTTLGVRIHEVKRVELAREIIEVRTPWGPCRVKKAMVPGQEARIAPEYEDCKRIAKQHGVPIRKVYEDVQALARKA